MHLLVIFDAPSALRVAFQKEKHRVQPMFILISINQFLTPEPLRRDLRSPDWTLPHALGWERILLPFKGNVRRQSSAELHYIYILTSPRPVFPP